MRQRTKTAWIAALVVTAAAAPARAQDAAPAQAPVQDTELRDGRWLPYLGCWVEEGVTDGPMTCVVPDGEGVTFLTVVNAEVTERRTVRGDEVPRPVDVEGCTGTEKAQFSADGHRVFTEAELTCSGAERRTEGLMAMVEPDRWIDVRALVDRETSVAWVTRYQPAPATRVTMAGLGARVAAGPSRAVETARVAASARIRVDEIIEAHARTDTEAVRAWIAEQGEPLRLDADRLVELADAGVDPEVIDVAVAVSFPDRFALEREPRDQDGRALDRYGYGSVYGWDGWGLWSPSPWGSYYDPFYSPYDRWYGYNRYGGYGYSPYGPSVVVVRPVTPVESSGGGRIVKGRGFVPSSGAPRGTATRPSARTSPPSSARGAVTGSSSSSSSSSSSKGKAKRRGSGSGGSGG